MYTIAGVYSLVGKSANAGSGVNIAKMNGSAQFSKAFRNQAVLVTGGMGFIGSHLCAELARRGANVTALDLSTEPARESLLNFQDQHIRKRIRTVEGDIADAPFVQDLIAHGSFRYIFNLAAGATVIERAVEDPVKTVESSTTALVNILEAVRRAPQAPQVVFQASTDKVYGDAGGEPYDEDRTPLQSVGLYDCAKLTADILTRAWFSVFKVPTVVLRLCNIFGPSDFNSGYRLVPRAMKALFSGDQPQPPELYFESIDHQRDYLFIDDCVRAMLMLANCPHVHGQAYNLPGCCHLSTPEMFREIINAAVQVEEQYDPARAEIIRKNGATLKLTDKKPQVITIKVQRCTGEKLRQATGFAPQLALSEALVRTAQASREYYRGRASYRLAPASRSASRGESPTRLAG